MRRLIPSLFLSILPVFGIDIRIYSEFQRVDPTGAVVPQDRAIAPREALSPAVVRNAFASFHVVVTAPPNTLYFLATQTNPADVVRIKLYRQTFAHMPSGFVSHGLVEEPRSSFLAGVTPSIGKAGIDTASAYLLDLWVPADARPGTVRVEVLVKTADWKVAPMELRILDVTAKPLPPCIGPVRSIDPAEASDYIAIEELLSASPLDCAPAALTIPAIILRNARQDAAFIDRTILGPLLAVILERKWAYFSPRGAELYLPVRQEIHRQAAGATRRAIRETPTRAPD